MPLDKATAGVTPIEKRRAATWATIPEAVQVAIVFLPVLFTIVFIYAFAVDAPFGDQWEVVPALMHMEAGHLQWSDIYRQHNEAFVPVSMAVTLLLAKVTHYDVVAEAYLASACLVGALAVLFAFFRRLQRKVPIATLAFLPVSTIFLGWRGHEGILWGAGLNSNLGLLLLLLTIWAAIRTTESPRFFGLAIVIAVLATFAFGSGLLAWPIGLAILLFPAEGRRSRGLVVLWAAVAVATTAVYFHGYTVHQVPWPTGLKYVLANPIAASEYVLVYTGSALGASPRSDALINLVLMLLFLPAAWTVVRDPELRKALLPFAAVLAFLVLTIPPVLFGRLGLGVAQPYTASRYASISALGPLGIYVCLLALAARFKVWRNVLGIALIVLSIGIVGGYQEGLAYAQLDHSKKTACREILRNYRMLDDAHLTCFFPDFEVGRRRAFWLDEYHLSVFRNQGSSPRADR
jgi:hypothetical protein